MSLFKEDHGRRQELEEAFTKFADLLFRHACFRLGDREKAKDVVQQTFMKTWDYLAQGKEISNMKAFLYTTVNRLIINEWRKRRALSLESLLAGASLGEGDHLTQDESEKLENRDEIERLLKQLGNLNEEYSQVITMRYIEDLPIREIAELLGESENNVSVRLHRALKLLREIKTQHD